MYFYLGISIILFWGQQAAAATTGSRQVSTHEPQPWRTLLNAPAARVALSPTPKDILPGAYGIISALGTGKTLGVDASSKLGAQVTLQVWHNSFATQNWVFTGYNQIALTGSSNTCLCASGLAELTGTPAYTDVCDNSDVRQKFTLSPEYFGSNRSSGLVYGTISPVNDPSACLDVYGEVGEPNRPLIIFVCHPKNTNKNNQKWTFFQAG